MFGRVLTVVVLLALIVLSFMLQSVSPTSSSPIVLLAIFFLLYVVLTGSITWLIHGLSVLLHASSKSLRLKKPIALVSMGHAYYYSSVISLGPVMLLAITSVMQPKLYEICLVLLFVVIGTFYVKKRLQ